MEIILFIAVVVLFVLNARLSGRVATLEAQAEAEGFAPLPQRPAEPAAAESAAAPVIAVSAIPVVEPPRPEPAAFTAESVDAELVAETRSAAEAAHYASLGGLFEAFVGGRLLIWIGGIALAVAGIFMVRFSAGLITPPVRMILAALFGLALLAAGELARSRPGALPDPRVPQALVGAGILVLYATPYGAWILYHLISTGTASTLMVMVTAAALILSLRHGAPAAVMGLVGGFATPLLVGDPSSSAIPLLGYLALLDIALFAIASRRGWTWMAASAVLLSFAWTGYLLGYPRDDALAAGTFILILSVAASLLRTGPGWQLDFIRPAALGLVELALLVSRLDLGLPAWLLFGALSLAAFLLATRRAEFRPIPAFALLLALLLIAGKGWREPDIGGIAAATTLLFASGAGALALRRPEKLLWTAIACAAFAGPALILRLERPELLDPRAWGGLVLLLSAGPLLLAWASRDAEGHARLVGAASALLLAAIALTDLLPLDLVAMGWLVLALAAGLAGRRSVESGLDTLALLTASAALLWSATRVPGLWTSLAASLGGIPALAATLPDVATALQALALLAPLLVGLWYLLPRQDRVARNFLLGAAIFCIAASGYILFKQAWGLTDRADFVARGFPERLIITQALFAAGWAVCRLPLPWLGAPERRLAGIALTAFAAARLLWFDMLIDNPVAVAQSVGAMPVINWLAPAFLLSAFWLYAARRGAEDPARSGVWLGLFLAALVMGVMLMVRQGFHGAILGSASITSEESYAYSLAALLLSLALLLWGVRQPDKALRIAGLALLTATTLKVFLIDASALEGLLRILSFLALGFALIGIGKLYTKVLDAERRTPQGEAA